MPRVPVRVIGSSGLSHGMKTAGTRSSIRFGELPELDLSGVEQIVEHSQVRAIAEACILLCSAATNNRAGPMASRELPLPEALAQLQAQIDEGGLDVLKPGKRTGNFAAPRMLEVGAALSRLRSLQAAGLPQSCPRHPEEERAPAARGAERPRVAVG